MNQEVLLKDRIRAINSKEGFCFIPNTFYNKGFFVNLTNNEKLLYFFLILVSDRFGMSYYHYDKICNILNFELNDLLSARSGLIKRDLAAFSSPKFQLLSLPLNPDLLNKNNINPNSNNLNPKIANLIKSFFK